MRGASSAAALFDLETESPVRVFDPLRQGVALPHAAVFHPLGFPLELATNSEDVIAAARGNWQGLPGLFSEPVLRLEVGVDEESRGPCPETLAFRARRHLLTMISDRANFAVCDLERAFAFCWFSPATARNKAWLRYFYLDTIVYLILWHKCLTRIHASCVARDGRAILLCGPAGAGKSCLAYACARRGWTFVSDEATSLLRRSEDRLVLGKPREMRFRDSAVEILPELAGRPVARNFAGKMTIEVPTSELTGISTAVQCRAVAVVFLNRHSGGPARLVTLPFEESWRRLEQDLPLFDQEVHAQHRASLRHLLEAGAYELQYCGLEAAVAVLESLVRS